MKNIITFLFLMIVAAATAQPFANDITEFKKKDSQNFPPAHAILLIGSSSFTLWKDVQNDFPEFTILNRGFGGSTLLDQIYYQNEIIYPYRPKQIIIYCGENDIANDSTVTGKIVFERFKKLYFDIRSHYPKIPIAYVSMKPSISRWHLKNKYREGNGSIQKFLKKKKNTSFVNVWAAMLGANGTPLEDIFIADKLHMNKKGYTIWQKLIQPILVR